MENNYDDPLNNPILRAYIQGIAEHSAGGSGLGYWDAKGNYIAPAGTQLSGGAPGGGLPFQGVGTGPAPAALQTTASAPEAAGAVGLPTAVPGLPASVVGPTGAGASSIGAPITFAGGVPVATGVSLLGKVGAGLKMAGAGIGAADKAAANNRSVEDEFNQRNAELELQHNAQDQSAYGLNATTQVSAYNASEAARQALENELINRATLEGGQRHTDLINLYKESSAMNPSRGPYDAKGAPSLSAAYLQALHDVGGQGAAELSHPRVYNASTMAAPTNKPYVAPPLYVPPTWVPPTKKKPGTLESAGNWLGPTLSAASTILGAFA